MYMYSARPRAKSLPDQEDFDPDYETEFDEEEGKRTRVDRDRGGPSLMEAMERERGLGIFLSHLKDAGLAEILLGSDDEEDNDSAGGFTIFAPTDRAWAKASKLVLGSVFGHMISASQPSTPLHPLFSQTLSDSSEISP